MTESTVAVLDVPEPEVLPWNMFGVRVADARRLTPHLVRVTFRSHDPADDVLAHFADGGADQRLKLILPADGHDLSVLTAGADWYLRLRDLPERVRPAVRTYTVRTVRPGAPAEVDVDMVLHGINGPASAWLSRVVEGFEQTGAAPGSDARVVLLGPDARHGGPYGGREFRTDVTADLLLAADETALPAVAAILEELPVHATGTALLEVPTADDVLDLRAPSGVTLRWLPRDGAASGERLVAAAHEWAPGRLDERPDPASSVRTPVADPDDWEVLLWEVPDDVGVVAAQGIRAWVAGEAAAVRTIRRHLVGSCGLARRDVAFMGYWRLGRAEG